MTQLTLTSYEALARWPAHKPLPKGLDAVWASAQGHLQPFARRRNRFIREAASIIALEENFAKMSSAELASCQDSLRERFRRSRDVRTDLHRAFALVREVAWRERGEKPYLVQVAGALALEAGCVAEMATGEGKTLTATMPAVIAGWRGRGCHLITANDYLAQRDANAMAPIYEACAVTVAAVTTESDTAARRAAYRACVTYLTSKEAAGDHLRDRLALAGVCRLSDALARDLTGAPVATPIQRSLECAIVDEADAVLIDEAVTPLILSASAPNTEETHAYEQAATMARNFERTKHYIVDEAHREVRLTFDGFTLLDSLRRDQTAELSAVFSGARRAEEMLTQALTARELFLPGKQYVVQDNRPVIVDEFTGRLMPDREWRAGQHQAVQAKEDLPISAPKETLARISFQRFFRLYRKLSGMTGTAREGRREFWDIYRMPVVSIPTNKPVARTRRPAKLYVNAPSKRRQIIAAIQTAHERSQPILVGARSVRESDTLSKLLEDRHLPHSVLNAERHAEEASIIARAGAHACITIATNMAGRGTDIKLEDKSRAAGGLFVIATEMHEAARIDRQLFGRAGRQGDPGACQLFASLDDELIQRFGGPFMLLTKTFGEHPPRTLALFALRRAQRRAEKHARRLRKAVLRSDDWLDDSLAFSGRE